MYKWDAEEYRKSSSNQERWAKELMKNLELNGDEHILDIGCGDGRITAEIAVKVPKGNVLGIDNSDDMIKLAQKTFSPEEYTNLEFRNMDAQFLDFGNEFEVIFSNAALHWVKDHSPVLEGMQKSLKTKGRIVLQMAGKGNAQEIIDVLTEIIKLEKWEKYFHDLEFPYGFFSDEEYCEMLKDADFKPIKVKLIPKIMVHSNMGELKGWIRTTWLPYTHKVPQELQEEFITEIATAYVEKNHENSQKIEIKMVRLEVEAEKE